MTILRSLAFAIAVLLAGTPVLGPAFAQDTQAAGAIRQVIEQQLAAFQRDDGAKAFSFASPGIQQRFRTPEIFMQMVRSGYAPVYRPREVEFRELRINGQTIQQEVLFVGPDGKPVLALYTMQQQADGSWRIAGVILLEAPDASV